MSESKITYQVITRCDKFSQWRFYGSSFQNAFKYAKWACHKSKRLGEVFLQVFYEYDYLHLTHSFGRMDIERCKDHFEFMPILDIILTKMKKEVMIKIKSN